LTPSLQEVIYGAESHEESTKEKSHEIDRVKNSPREIGSHEKRERCEHTSQRRVATQ
jgi:hypothetical protein